MTMNFVKHRMADVVAGKVSADGSDAAEIHILAAGVKPVFTWYAESPIQCKNKASFDMSLDTACNLCVCGRFKNNALQVARECCGGQGYHAANGIGVLRTDLDIDTTWEGDNTVLLQQVSASLMKEFKRQFAGGRQFR